MSNFLFALLFPILLFNAELVVFAFGFWRDICCLFGGDGRGNVFVFGSGREYSSLMVLATEVEKGVFKRGECLEFIVVAFDRGGNIHRFAMAVNNVRLAISHSLPYANQVKLIVSKTVECLEKRKKTCSGYIVFLFTSSVHSISLYIPKIDTSKTRTMTNLGVSGIRRT